MVRIQRGNPRQRIIITNANLLQELVIAAGPFHCMQTECWADAVE
jgi:hypothetical protein